MWLPKHHKSILTSDTHPQSLWNAYIWRKHKYPGVLHSAESHLICYVSTISIGSNELPVATAAMTPSFQQLCGCPEGWIHPCSLQRLQLWEAEWLT